MHSTEEVYQQETLQSNLMPTHVFDRPSTLSRLFHTLTNQPIRDQRAKTGWTNILPTSPQMWY